MFYSITKLLLGWIIRIFWVEKVEGIHYLPKKGPIIIAANHASFLDFALLVVASKRRLYFLVSDFFYKNPFFRLILRMTGQIKVDSFKKGRSAVYQAAEDVLKRGHVLVIFPEGTRSNDGKLLKAYKGVARISLQNEADILPVAIKESHVVWRRGKFFPSFKKICKVVFLQPIIYKEIKHKEPKEIVHKILMPELARELGHSYDHDV
ncbi:MAG: 1-acyl-sn-glycerol-3-phosphate acyltransferase [candidate division CPR2 bacterium GW2011_GWC1_39_9]|uniref:1-acyl-sn-glycerol-3-phosphate acyltransferase n=1 Tax=candidate division CPR2 bacterium GW2011_GWC2_39_10 TaxID=1618345 RepID=A0A0G0M3H4_UNCC2|nr:MAG: 1-acyl-sn-glycerol-3-phosphate acyltransferase [candidate division CPR2 bacterium GW2011_GWC2_39_10]KKR32573.1 MAG: 1-acyl-sn-glycerol-3-phosphate acyltransferase [candidate division CPR2 bacterium GW2011_GWC1_39_9]